MEEKHVARYAALFCHRQDLHAVQKPDGSYALVREPVTRDLVRRHLQGDITCGWYALAQDDTVAWAALDADQDSGLENLSHTWKTLDGLGLAAYLEGSRRGGHLWLFVEAMPAVIPRRLLQQIIRQLGIEQIEIFPKQDHLPLGGVGNLMRGPLGRHLRTGERYPFLDPLTLTPVGSKLVEQLDFLLDVRVNTLAEVATALACLPGRTMYHEREVPPRSARSGDRIVELKAAIGDVYDFVAQYVALDERGRGSCPFHPPDHHPSFAVDRERGYWVCFHEVNPETGRYLGGDAIEFYRRLKGLSFKEAVLDLAKQCSIDDPLF